MKSGATVPNVLIIPKKVFHSLLLNNNFCFIFTYHVLNFLKGTASSSESSSDTSAEESETEEEEEEDDNGDKDEELNHQTKQVIQKEPPSKENDEGNSTEPPSPSAIDTSPASAHSITPKNRYTFDFFRIFCHNYIIKIMASELIIIFTFLIRFFISVFNLLTLV